MSVKDGLQSSVHGLGSVSDLGKTWTARLGEDNGPKPIKTAKENQYSLQIVGSKP